MKLNLIIIHIFFVLISCNSKITENSAKNHKHDLILDNSSVKLDSIPVSQNYVEIDFRSNQFNNLVSNYHLKITIDSISAKKDSFVGTYLHCGRGDINMDPFAIYKKENSKRHKSLESITTAHLIRTQQNDSVYISGVKDLDCFPELESRDVNILCTIYQLYSKNEFIANIPIIENVAEIKE